MKNQMKYAALAIAVGLLANNTTQAQEVEFGVTLGSIYNMPSYTNKGVSNAKSEFGAQVGVFARTADRLYFQPELLFSVVGTSYTFEGKKHNPTSYQLSLPIQAGYKIYDSEKLSMRAALGPQLNYQLKSAKATSVDSYKTFSYDAKAGIGVDLSSFTIDLSYNHGLNKTSKELGSRNRSLGLSLGYKF